MTDLLPVNPTNWVNDKVKKLKRKVNNFLTGDWTVRTNLGKKDICEFDTLLSYDYQSSSDLPSYPIQQGSFENYNKIQNPNKANVSLAISGNKTEIRKNLIKLESFNESVDLVDLILPFKSFIGYNLCNLSHSLHEGEGISMLVVNFDLFEIRQAEIKFKKTKANYKGTQNTGKTNPQQPNQSLLKGLFS